MDDLEVQALNIIRGECNGDEFLWDADTVVDGIPVKGAWRSQLEKAEQQR